MAETEAPPGIREYYIPRGVLVQLRGKIAAFRKPPQFPFGYTLILELREEVAISVRSKPRGVDVFREVAQFRYNLNEPEGIRYWDSELAKRRENEKLIDLVDASNWEADMAAPHSHFDWRATGFTLPEVAPISQRAQKLTQLVTAYLDDYGL